MNKPTKTPVEMHDENLDDVNGGMGAGQSTNQRRFIAEQIMIQ